MPPNEGRTKQFTKIEVKDADQGLVTAVFATLNVIDSDGDVTLPGAFTDGEAVRMSAYGHGSWTGKLPIGRGTIKEVDDEAIFEGKFFLDTVEGRESFEVVKAMAEPPDLSEWSYGFDILDGAPGQFEGQDVYFLRKLKVFEVSPVLLGAGVDTRTLAVKNAKKKFADHLDTVVTDVEEVTKRAQEVVTLRAAEGKSLSEERKDVLHRLESAVTDLREVLTSADGSKSDEGDAPVEFPGLDLEAMFLQRR